MKPFDFSIGDLFHPFEGRKFNHIDVPCLDCGEPDCSVRDRAQDQTIDEGLVAPVVGGALEHEALARLPLDDLKGPVPGGNRSSLPTPSGSDSFGTTVNG